MEKLTKEELEVLFKALTVLVESTEDELRVHTRMAETGQTYMGMPVPEQIAETARERATEDKANIELYKEYEITLKAKLLNIYKEGEIKSL